MRIGGRRVGDVEWEMEVEVRRRKGGGRRKEKEGRRRERRKRRRKPELQESRGLLDDQK